MKRLLAIACLVLVGPASVSVPAQQAVVPFAVVRDGNGDVLRYPLVRITDPDAGNPVFVELRNSTRLRAFVLTTYD